MARAEAKKHMNRVIFGDCRDTMRGLIEQGGEGADVRDLAALLRAALIRRAGRAN